jgi:hypothetical protein
MSSPTNPLRPDQIYPTKGIQPSQEIEEGTGSNFQEMMQSPVSQAQSSQAPSPMNILPGTNPVSGPSVDTMQSQLNVSQSNLLDMQAQAQTANLKIHPNDKELLVKNMSGASDNLRSANQKLGINPGPNPKPLEGPLGKFVSLINDGSSQIASAKAKLAEMGSSGAQLNPAEMLLVQVKINQAQQQIEFSSVLLSKVVDDFKQLMNIQI